jgi:hypothetical protein
VRICTACGLVKPLDEFTPTNGAAYRKKTCKPFRAAAAKATNHHRPLSRPKRQLATERTCTECGARSNRESRRSVPKGGPNFAAAPHVGWDATLLEIEHQAKHWDTPDHGVTGHLIAQALHAAVSIARVGGLRCEHRGGSLIVPEAVLELIEGNPAAPVGSEPATERQRSPSAA